MRSKKLIQFYLTNQCNSHCKTCQIWTHKEVKELDVNVVKKVIDEFPDADYVFGGGEATMYSHIDELLNYCTQNNVNYTLLSNCINTITLRSIVKYHNIKNVTISFDGINHDEIRGSKGNLRSIIDFIMNKPACLENLKISYTLSKYNEDTFDHDMLLFKSLGIDKVYFCMATTFVGTKVKNLLEVNTFDILRHKDMLFDKDAAFIEALNEDRIHDCDSRNDVWTILENGDVMMCQDRPDVLGNIYKDSLKDIYHERKFEPCPFNKTCYHMCQRRYDNYEK